ncbi:MAG: hypothetical protein NTW17_00270 [Candidatus Pacearchaeota archaeon]|nr:hypothetical protein [Candidatus Pacearchaeota archaeon]
MPKKSPDKKTGKQNNKKLGNLFKKFALKNQQRESAEEETEEEIEEEIEIPNLNLNARDFTPMDLSEEGSPVLERRAMSAPRPIFVGGIPQGNASGDADEGESKNGFKYVPGAANANEPKYIPTSETAGTPAERINMETLGRRQEFFPQANQEAFFERASESRGFSSQNAERFERTERFDIEKAGRSNPFERQEAKYEKYKPKMPKS